MEVLKNVEKCTQADEGNGHFPFSYGSYRSIQGSFPQIPVFSRHTALLWTVGFGIQDAFRICNRIVTKYITNKVKLQDDYAIFTRFLRDLAKN